MKKEYQKALIVILVSSILINPTLLWIVSHNLFISLISFILVALTSLILFRYHVTRKLFHVYLTILVTFSFFIHAEAIFITVFSEYKIENLYRIGNGFYFNKEGLEQTFIDKEFIVHYKTNHQGFRIGREDNPETTIEKIDWLFLGDSYTQGAQVDFEQLYTSQLYNSFPNKIILNAGISGWGIPQAYNYYANEGRKLNPSIVFLQICNFNDFMNVKSTEAGFIDYLMDKSEFLRYVLYDFRYSNPAELPLGRWTEPFYPDYESNSHYNVFFKKKSIQQENDLQKFSKYLEDLNNAIESNGARLVVLQIPTKEQLYFRYFEEVVDVFNIDPRDLDMNFPNKFLDSLCSNLNITRIDFYDSLSIDNREVFFNYDEHLNPYGHHKLATILSQIIESDTIKSRPIFLSNYNSEDRYPSTIGKDTLLFQSVRDSNIELFITDTSFSKVNRITFNDIDESHPIFNYSLKKIFFTEGDQALGKTRVASINLTGGNREYLIESDSIYSAIPFVNNTGSLITFPKWRLDHNGYFTNPTISVIDNENKKINSISSDSLAAWRPIISPDNQFIYYIAKFNEANHDIYRFNRITNQTENITNSEWDEWDPHISPSGEFLTFTAFRNQNWDLYNLNLKTNDLSQVTHSSGDEWDPFWANDSTLYFAGTFGFVNGIYRLNVK